MGAEWVAIYITVIGAAGTAINLWITTRISNSILKLELRITEKFATKEEMERGLSPLRETIQQMWSRRAVFGTGHE